MRLMVAPRAGGMGHPCVSCGVFGADGRRTQRPPPAWSTPWRLCTKTSRLSNGEGRTLLAVSHGFGAFLRKKCMGAAKAQGS